MSNYNRCRSPFSIVLMPSSLTLFHKEVSDPITESLIIIIIIIITLLKSQASSLAQVLKLIRETKKVMEFTVCYMYMYVIYESRDKTSL